MSAAVNGPMYIDHVPARIAGEITRLMAEKLLIDVASPETDLLTGGLLDSLSMVQLLVHLECHFGIKIPLDQLEIEDLRSVDSIARMVLDRSQA
jgi:acyl carrier protein